MTAPLHINALVTEVAVNMGDHAGDVTKAVVVDPDETVAALVERILTARKWAPRDVDARGWTLEPNPAKFLTLRLAVVDPEEGR